jgi:hypothetical protein
MGNFLNESVDAPYLCGSDALIASAMAKTEPVFLPYSDLNYAGIHGAFAVALHMHQPLVPAGSGDLRTAPVISNLRYMAEHPEVPDAHNAPVFRWCYKRMGEFIPQLVREGKSPRVMLDFSGCLLHGLRQMGADDVIDSLRPLAQDPAYQRCVEWLGTAWGHAVAPSTPSQDFRLHVRAWQHQFADLFGLEALGRVRGFSPPEMALPNHPDVCYEFVKTLLDCGYRWVLVQEHSVERFEDGGRLRHPHLPHRLIARNSRGQSVGITAIIKTQGSDTKLVAQMQPYYEARGLPRIELGGKLVPQLVTQIGDGENGGVMMNEFPPMFLRVMADASGSPTPAMNATEYLEHLAVAGVRAEDLPMVRPIFQKRIWDRFEEAAGPAALASVIAQLRQEDNRFHMDGGSWTADISWVRGYDNILNPMAKASALFAAKAARMPANDPHYCNALFYLLLSQTSCFRYWGQGMWTDYGIELCRRTIEILELGN